MCRHRSGLLRWVLLCSAVLASALPASAQRQIVVQGRVVEAGAGDPVAGAEIRTVTGDARAVTASDGVWRLTVPAGTRELVVAHVGFAERRVDVPADADVTMRVALTPRPVSLGGLVVTASRRLQELKDVPVATEVVARTEIEQTGASDLSAVLTERTGVTLEGGHPVGAGVMLQGLGSERVLVLLDGQPFIGRISGGLDLSRIPTAMIEQVEVVKGPQSTLYGSEAMGGVVNVITRAPQHGVWQGGIDAIGGSNGRVDLSTNLMGGIGDVAWSLDGGRRTIELVPGHDGTAGTFATRWDGNLRTQWRMSPSLTLLAGGLLLDERQRWRSGVLYNFSDNLQWGGRLGADWTRGGHRLAPTFYATEFRHLSRRSTLPEPVAGDADAPETQRLIEAELLYGHATERVAFDAGVEARREAIRSDRVVGGERTMQTVEPFAQTTFSGDAWSVVPGVRMTWSEQWGTHVTPRVAALVRPLEPLALRVSVGQGFRAPAFKELYMEFLNASGGEGYRVRGNEALLPETSRNVTGSVEWSGDRIYSRVQLFYNRFDDFIETRELPSEGGLRVFTYGNIDDGETYGAELELGTTWRGLRAEAGYTWLEARDRTADEPLLGRARHSGRASLAYALPFGLRASVSAIHSGRTPTARDESGLLVHRDALTRVDARIAQQLPYGLEASLGIDNVFDATLDDYPGHLGRQLYLGLGWRASRDVGPARP